MKAITETFLKRPSTRLGWGAVGIAVACVVLIIITATMVMNTQVNEAGPQSAAPNMGIPIVFFGLAAGIVGLIAVIRQHERSWLVWLALLPGIVSIVLLIRDLLVAL